MLAIGSIIRLKLLHDDIPPNVNLIEIKASIPRVIIVFNAEENFKTNLLNTSSISNF